VKYRHVQGLPGFLGLLAVLALLPGLVLASPWLTARQARTWLTAQKHLHIVDVRDSAAYRAATLSGAVNLTLVTLRSMQSEPTAHVLLIVDRAPNLSGLTADYAEIRLLAANRSAWKKAGLHMVRIRVTKPAFQIPTGLCEMGVPANTYPDETVEEDIR